MMIWNFILLLLASTFLAYSQEWSRFRGPQGAGKTDIKGLPVEWSDNKNIDWKVKLPGYGSSSPVLHGKKIFLTAYSGYGVDRRGGNPSQLNYHVICIENGKIKWNKAIPAKNKEARYSGFTALHGYASSTPVVDDNFVYAFFGPNGVYALDHSGKVKWHTNVGTSTHSWSSGPSPILYKDLVLVNASIESGSLVALNKKTGKEVWRQGGMEQAWTTPIIVNAGGRDLVIAHIKKKVLALDAKTGKEVWSAQGIKDYVCPSVIEHDGILYVNGGRPRPAGMLALKADTGKKLWWLPKAGNNVTSAVYHDGYLYFLHDSTGTAYCINAKTGKLAYEQRLEPRAGKTYASAFLAEDRIYYVTREKGTFVIEASPTFKLIAHNTFSGDKSIFNASPVPMKGGKLLLRSDEALYCIGK